MEKLKITRTVFPNGDILKYSEGMDKPIILPSNHPDVIKMLYKRICLNK